MARKIAMIPALTGSQRIPEKNLILVNGKPLCTYSIEACIQAEVFDAIYLSSDDEKLEQIANEHGVFFHKREAEQGGKSCIQKNKSRHCQGNRCSVNEHYLQHFMKSTDSDLVFQVNPTSPLLEASTIRAFVADMQTKNADSAFATLQVFAESFFQTEPLSFSLKRKVPSQELNPLDVICWAIAGWRKQNFLDVYNRDQSNESAAVFSGNIALFPISDVEAIDIDDWSTLELAEQFLIQRSKGKPKEWQYIDGRPANNKS